MLRPLALPTPPPYTNPIPNNPFYAPLNAYVCGPYFPVAIGNGIDLTTATTVPALTNDVANVLSAGAGIALTTFLGVTTITATGGGGGGSPATPTVSGTIYGCTEDPNSLYNTYIGKNAGLGTNTLDSNNTAVGVGSLQNIVDGSDNTALGKDSLSSNASGGVNVAIGGSALFSATGSANVAVGYGAGQQLTTGGFNTLLGNYTLSQATTGQCNVAIGINALNSVDVGSCNIAIGSGTASSLISGDRNVAIGPDVEVVDGTLDCQLVIGANANAYWLTGDSNLAIKPGAGIIDCAGSCGTAGQVLSSDGANAIEWVTGGGASSATPIAEGIVFGCTDAVNFNYGLGDGILGALTTGTLNIAIGTGALATTDSGTSNTAVGIGALFGNTSGTQNVALGQQALFSATTAGLNTAIGSQSLQNTTGGANTALGNFAGNVLTTGSSNILIGNQAGGAGAGALDTGNNNVVIGNCVSVVSNSGDCQLAIGVNTICWLTGTSTGAIKPGAGIIDCANSCGTAGQVLMSNGSNRVCWGTAGAPAATPTVRGTLFGCSVADNTGVGLNVLQSLSAGIFGNVAVGCDSLCSTTTGISNTAVGQNSMPSNTSGCQNTAVGSGALFLNSTGTFNTAVGNNNLVLNSTGSCNTALGQGALYSSTGNNNVALGFNSGCDALCTLNTQSNFVILGNNLTACVISKVAVTVPSDTRWKKIAGEVPLALPFVNSLNPIKYQYCDAATGEVTDERYRYGFCAQEILANEENPQHPIITGIDNEEMYSLNETQLLPVLVNAIKELSAKVEALEAKLEANG